MYCLAKVIVITDKSLRSFFVFVRVAVKHFTTSNRINYEAITINWCERVSVFVP
jgi:hypothetical protein